jgi:TPR repeat protein
MSKRPSDSGEPPAKEARLGEEFLCPLTKRLPIDPVTAEDGNTYERAAITEYLKDKTTSPVDSTPMTASLRPNNMVRRAIERLMESAPAEEREAYLAEVKTHTMVRAKTLFEEGKVLEAAELGLPEACGKMADQCYFEIKDYVQAIAWAQKASTHGDTVMFYCHYHGRGTEQNWRAAVDLFESCKADNLIVNVGDIYRFGGHGIEQDYRKAFDYYTDKFKTSPWAAAALGHMYEQGLGVPQNYLLAKKMYKAWSQCDKYIQRLNEAAQKLFDEGKVLEAAEMGLAKAQGIMAQRCYSTGGPESERWAKMAAEEGDANGHYYLGHHLKAKNDWKEALTCYIAAYVKGKLESALSAASIYTAGGFGVVRDYGVAMRWLEKTPEDPEAQCAIGELHRQGWGVAKNYILAKRWYMKSAAKDFPKAKQELENMTAEATKLFDAGKVLEAAEMGLGRAQGIMASRYYNGSGVPKSYPMVVTWAQLAIENKDSTGYCYMGLCYENGHGVEKNWKLAVQMYMGSGPTWRLAPTVYYSLGEMNYKGGFGLERDFVAAAKWYDLAIKSDEDGDAWFKLGCMYQHGEGVAKDWKKAVKLFETAYELFETNSNAFKQMGLMYSVGGFRLPPDSKKAAACFEHGLPDPDCMFKLAECYHKGTGVDKDDKLARQWFKTASEKEGAFKAMAQREYAKMVIKGEGGKGGDLATGCRLLQVAAETDAEARAIVERIRAC